MQQVKGGKKKDFGLPFILMFFKLCIKYNVSVPTIKSLSYNDCLALIIDFQIDDINNYLDSKKDNKNEVIYADEEQVTNLLCGKIPIEKEV